MPETFAQFLDKWLKHATSQGLSNPLVKMPVKRFRLLQLDELAALEKGRQISLGTTSEPIVRNLFKNFKARQRERGEHCAFVCYGSVEMTIAGAVGQPSRSALFPIALKRINLECLKETIKAAYPDESPWEFNRVLSANLRGLNIHLKTETITEPTEFISLLRVTLGNRASKVQTDAYVGLFSNQQMVLHARLSEASLKQSLAMNPLIKAKISGERLTSPLRGEVCDDGIEELGLVLPCDDSQLRVVQLTNAGTSLQVEGPPGTGKSQTIANIISNALYNGKTALLVCDKRPAIAQVEERLAGCGLKPALLNLHDEDLDKREFLKQAVAGFNVKLFGPPSYPTEELAESRKTLNERVVFGRSTVHPALHVSKREALNGLLHLKKLLKSVPTLPIANLKAMSSDRVRKLLSAINEWQELESVVTESENIWNRAKPEAFEENPNATNEVAEIIGRMMDQIGALDDLRETAATIGVEMPLRSYENCIAVHQLCEVVLARPACHPHLVGNTQISRGELESLKTAADRMEELLSKNFPFALSEPLNPEFELESAAIVKAEACSSWSAFDEKLESYGTRIEALGAIEKKYARLSGIVGLVPSDNLNIRSAQLRGVISLGSGTATIPRSWWKPNARPVHQIAEWRGHFQSCAAHVLRGAFPLNCLALERLRESHWSHLEAKAEHGFNAVSYCFHFVNDRKCKYAMRQMFPAIPKGFKEWESLLLHAVAADGILKSLRATAETHPALQQLTSAYLASAHEGVPCEPYIDHEEVGRLEAAAQLVEQVRANTELYDTSSSHWLAFWETPSSQIMAEIEALLRELETLELPIENRFASSIQDLQSRFERIKKFLTHAKGGNRTNRVDENISAHHEYRRLKLQLEALSKYLRLTNSSEPDWKRLFELIHWRDQFERLQGPQKLDIENRVWIRLRDSLQKHLHILSENAKALGEFFDEVSLNADYSKVQRLLQEILAQLPEHQLWLEKGRWTKKVSAYPEISNLWSKVLDGSVLTKDASKLFCFNLLRQCEPVQKTKRAEFGQLVKTFTEHDEMLEGWMIENLKARLNKRRNRAADEYPQQESELRRLSDLQRIRGTVREILNANIEFLMAAKPCWMMSPTSLANLVDSAVFENRPLPFDMVIFDEASQVRVLDGLLSMAFGKQTVIVGDKNQLPPTDFFSGFASEGEDAQDLGTSESMLDEFSTIFEAGKTQVMLMSHYRSETPDLIQFSNEWFYNSKLEVLPPCHISGIGRRLHYVANGVYSEIAGQRNNPGEAREVVKLIELHVRDAFEKSLGVVTMNIAQMELIEEFLRESECDELKAFCSDEAKFFLRNLESVQGDEMDRIILSLTYGKNPEGHFNASILGPLIKSGGERRLNVAITRSRSGLIVVSSLKSSDLETSNAQSKGFQCLKKLLSDLERDQAARTYGLTSQRFEPKNDGVANIVYCDSPFEMQVVEFLENEGFEVECQHGAGGYRIDIVVKENGRNLLAIECDGAAYHSSLVARTRDRARQRTLERLGWRFHRVWSTNWWHFEEQEKEAIRAAINAARNEVGSKRSTPKPPKDFVVGRG